jgi:iron complex transport system ATP-binding protein
MILNQYRVSIQAQGIEWNLDKIKSLFGEVFGAKPNHFSEINEASKAQTMIETFFHVSHGDVWRGETLALRDLSLSLRLGESVAILGVNGAGKSSLLKLMTGELRVAVRAGAACRLWGEEQWCLEELRHRIGIVMPEEVARFSPHELAEDVVRSAFRGSYGRTGDMRFRAAEKEVASEVMEELGILDLKNREFGALSSGEKRRFLIARALVFEPEVLVLDEPSTALDFAARLQMLERLRGLRTCLRSPE